MTPRDDDDLIPLLMAADTADLSVLVDYVTNSGKGRISLDNGVMSQLIAAQARAQFTDNDRTLLAHEIQLFGGNTLINLMRGGQGVAYREVAFDVARHLKVSAGKNDTIQTIEKSILEAVVREAWSNMSDTEKVELTKALHVHIAGLGPASLTAIINTLRSSRLAAYLFAEIAANAIARQLLGRGLVMGAEAGLARSAGVLFGPVGLAITGLWAIADMASPAYRVTVPCVVQLAYMRQKQQNRLCGGCQAANPPEAKFCAECGHKLH